MRINGARIQYNQGRTIDENQRKMKKMRRKKRKFKENEREKRACVIVCVGVCEREIEKEREKKERNQFIWNRTCRHRFTFNELGWGNFWCTINFCAPVFLLLLCLIMLSYYVTKDTITFKNELIR